MSAFFEGIECKGAYCANDNCAHDAAYKVGDRPLCSDCTRSTLPSMTSWGLSKWQFRRILDRFGKDMVALKAFLNTHNIHLIGPVNGRYKVMYTRVQWMFDEPWLLATKGTVFYWDQDGSLHVRFVLPKFFGSHEFPTKVHTSMEVLAHVNELAGCRLALNEKADGSFINVNWDDSRKELNVNTMGTMGANQKIQKDLDDSPTFCDMVQRLLNPTVAEFLQQHPRCTLIAELITPFNPVHTVYPEKKGTLRYNYIVDEDGHLTWDVLRELVPSEFMSNGLPRGGAWVTSDSLMEEFERRLQAYNADPARFGYVVEGCVLVVVCPDGKVVPIAKLKNKEWLELEHKEGNSLNPGNKDVTEMWQSAIVNGTADDLPDRFLNGVFAKFIQANMLDFRCALGILGTALGVLVGKLQSSPDGPEKRAFVQKSPPWLHGLLYKLAKSPTAANTVGTSELMQYLASSTGGKSTVLQCLWKQCGLNWWQQGTLELKKKSKGKPVEKPEDENHKKKPEEKSEEEQIMDEESTKLCVVDLDGTVFHEKKFDLSNPFRYKEFHKGNVTIFRSIVDFIKSQRERGVRIVFLTGRHADLYSQLKEYLDEEFGFDFELHCRTTKTSATDFKRARLLEIVNLIKCRRLEIQHFDDELSALEACADALKSKTYLGHHVKDGKVVQIVTAKDAGGFVVIQVGPTGDGKSTRAKLLQGLLGKDRLRIVSVDELKATFKNDKVVHDAVKAQVQDGVQCGVPVFLDTCGASKSWFTLLEKMGLRVLVCTFMPLPQPTDSKADIKRHFDQYKELLLERVIDRRHEHSTITMDVDEATVKDIVNRKHAGCLHQVNTRKGVVFLGPSTTLDEDVSRLRACVSEYIASIPRGSIGARAYLSISVGKKGHITMQPPSSVDMLNVTTVGSPVHVRFSITTISGARTTFRLAKVFNLDGSPIARWDNKPFHLTETVKPGCKSVDANLDIEELAVDKMAEIEFGPSVLAYIAVQQS